MSRMLSRMGVRRLEKDLPECSAQEDGAWVMVRDADGFAVPTIRPSAATSMERWAAHEGGWDHTLWAECWKFAAPQEESVPEAETFSSSSSSASASASASSSGAAARPAGSPSPGRAATMASQPTSSRSQMPPGQAALSSFASRASRATLPACPPAATPSARLLARLSAGSSPGPAPPASPPPSYEGLFGSCPRAPRPASCAPRTLRRKASGILRAASTATSTVNTASFAPPGNGGHPEEPHLQGLQPVLPYRPAFAGKELLPRMVISPPTPPPSDGEDRDELHGAEVFIRADDEYNRLRLVRGYYDADGWGDMGWEVVKEQWAWDEEVNEWVWMEG